MILRVLFGNNSQKHKEILVLSVRLTHHCQKKSEGFFVLSHHTSGVFVFGSK